MKLATFDAGDGVRIGVVAGDSVISTGFGGSMIWFGSSAGVAISNRFPQARSVGAWLRHGWFVALAYVVGYSALLGVLGWRP